MNQTVDSIIPPIAKCHVELADIYKQLHEYDLATEHLTDALNIYKDNQLINQQEEIASIEKRFGQIYVGLYQYELANKHLFHAIDLYTTKVPPEYNLALEYLIDVLKFDQDLNEYTAKFMSQEEKIAYIQEKITVVQTLMI